jgi:hypothetical protein
MITSFREHVARTSRRQLAFATFMDGALPITVGW